MRHPTQDRGRVYRRCGCRDTHRRQLGAHCPRLLCDPDHGTWTYAVDVPWPDTRRHTVRRGGYPNEDAARTDLHRFLDGKAYGYSPDPRQTTGDYLLAWLAAQELRLKPTTLARYRAYVHQDLIPALGHIPLDDLAYEHIDAYARAELAAGRGKVTVHRILATLSSALGAAVLRHRLGHNPAKPAIIPRPPTPERRIWTPDEAVRFLDYAHKHDPLFANLVELIINTGMRKGEALGLHWDDVHLDEGVLFVRYTLSTVDNHYIVLTAPKTPSSLSWIAINQRARRALEDLADHHFLGYTLPAHGYVFHHHGRPLNPKKVLDRFHRLCDEAGVPRIAVQDLRHLATTLALNGGVPFVIVSKTLRHRTLSTTANIYSHLTRQAAREAVDAIARILDSAELALHTTQRANQPRNLITQFRDHLTKRQRRTRRERPAHAPIPL
ncbi:site-specific integrase [Kitasatospora aureofaciens]|uniref:tyrosine-type recombinase/integrase n=1 Tax=Kitasatospora aureofaciens TaxID=1894 RepID=UPI001C4934FC|nr:site-specific integrase [Kitasatospora aureofaciens]MBV6703319.1 site-specific integrase [Kitasatospora aureofaciens]